MEENKLINLFKKIDIINFRKILSNKLKFLLKKKLSQKEDIQDKEELFYIGTYRDLDFNKREYGNAFERVKLSYQKSDFIQESILYTYFHKNEYWEILRKIAHFANQAGINKKGGIWMPTNAEEVKKCYESQF
ncbi:MAG: hypothetical protein HYU63_05020 [Armatimonadetes bacterium]|nr:hypothetical protein [Armatimonadota bacterium]